MTESTFIYEEFDEELLEEYVEREGMILAHTEDLLTLRKSQAIALAARNFNLYSRLEDEVAHAEDRIEKLNMRQESLWGRIFEKDEDLLEDDEPEHRYGDED